MLESHLRVIRAYCEHLPNPLSRFVVYDLILEKYKMLDTDDDRNALIQVLNN